MLRLLELPAELRNHIWTLLIADNNDPHPQDPPIPPITQTCAQIRTETLSMFLKHTKTLKILHFHRPTTLATTTSRLKHLGKMSKGALADYTPHRIPPRHRDSADLPQATTRSTSPI